MMSPTVNASSLPTADNPLYKLSQSRKTSDRSMASTDSISGGSGGVGGGGVSASPLRKPGGYATDLMSVSAPGDKRRASGGIVRDWLEAERDNWEEEEEVVLGAARLVHLPDALPRDRRKDSGSGGGSTWDEAGGDSRLGSLRSAYDRPAFPASASVSLPTSTSTLDYLLHQHTSRSGASHSNTGSSTLSTVTSSLGSPFSTSTTKVTPSSSSSDYLSKHNAGLDFASQEDVSSPSGAVTSDTMMTKTGADNSTTGSDHRQAGDMTRTSSGLVRGRHDSKAMSQQFFQVEPCLFTHRMFTRAAKIFQVLKSDDTDTVEAKASRRRRGELEEKKKIPDMDFRNAQEQIKTFELTFATLKYQDLFRDILEKTGFFHEFSNLRSDFSLVCIILFDLQSRKFQKRIPLPEELGESPSNGEVTTEIERGEEGYNETSSENLPLKAETYLDDVCTEIENALLSRKTRLQSSFAKERIKRNAPSIEHLLPEQVRHKDETKSINPVFCWVNQMKTSMENIIESLRREGFEELEDGQEISEQKTKTFRRDPHCSDLLVFPPNFSMYFKESEWVGTGQLVQQDKSSCLAPQTLHLLLGIDQDVIHVNVGTGMTTAHIASLLRHKSPHSHIWAFEPEDAEKTKRAARNLEFLGTKNTRIIPDHFLNSDPEDSKFKSVRVILITANCSKSAITSPVQFIVSEGEDMQILGELSQADSNLARVRELTHEHESLLKHALKFPRVQAVVYTTRSRYQAENEQVVNQVLEATNGPQNGRRAPFKVTPPVLPFTGDEIGTASGLVDGKFARFRPSDRSNGCFVAIISREPEDPKEAARSAIARARSRGMLDKSESTGQPTAEGDENTVTTGKSRSKNKKSNGAEVKSSGSGLKLKLSNHKSPASAGARLYQAGLINRMEQVKLRPPKPEHVKVIKHPAPFRG